MDSDSNRILKLNPDTNFPDPDSVDRNVGTQNHARSNMKPHGAGARLKCSFCRKSKKACSPTKRIWPGEKCQGCEAAGLSCSEPKGLQLGRPRKRESSQLDLDPDPPRLYRNPKEATGTSDNIEEHVDWINSVCFGQMLGDALATLKFIKLKWTQLFDKENMIVPSFWENCPGLQDCRDFECFVKRYQQGIRLRKAPDIPLGPSMQRASSLASLALSFDYRITIQNDAYLEDEELQKFDDNIAILASFKLFGPAMKMQVEKLKCCGTSTNREVQYGTDLTTLRRLMGQFSGWINTMLNMEEETSIPKTLLESPILFPEGFGHKYIYSIWNELSQDRDCLGRTVEQESLDRAGVGLPLYLPDLEVHDVLGRTYLHTMCQGSNPDPISNTNFQARIQQIARDINIKNCFQQQALHYTAATGNIVMFSYLLSMNDIQLVSRDCLGRSPIFYAAANGNLEILMVLLAKPFDDIDQKDVYGWSPLGIACRNSHERVFLYLISHGANPKQFNGQNCMPLIGQAILGRNIELVKILFFRENIDVSEPFGSVTQNNTRARSAVELAISIDFQEGVLFFMETAVWADAAADLLERAALSNRHLLVAVKSRSTETLTYLLGRHNSLYHGKIDGVSLLKRAVHNDDLQIVDILLTHPNVDINHPDDGYPTGSPLITAARRGNLAIVRSLLLHGDMDIGLRDIRGQTAEDIAHAQGLKEIAELLQTRAA